MKIGITGLPQTGKKTLFQILTQKEMTLQAGTAEPVPGTADILDTRFDRLVRLYAPRKKVRARIDLVLLPKIDQKTIAQGDVFKDIADMDALCHVVRAFEDDAVYHPKGSVDPLRDAEMINSELIIHDQIFVEKRIERLKDTLKKIKDKDQQKELALMEKMQAHLETEAPLRRMELSCDEELMIRSYPFITGKEMILALNVAEDDLDNQTLLNQFHGMCQSLQMEAMLVSAKLESEIALLDSDDEKAEFLEDLGITETALGALTRLCLKALGRISFFTVGEDEVRQWLVRENSTAPEAAGVIHSDLQKGFIRAEVMKYEELMELGSEAALKKNGKMYLMGKDYIVQDGDILNIRFNV